jgi:hypothetical protein
METEKVDIHQSLMDQAYKKYQANEEWSYKEFVTSLDFKEKVAVLTGNFNYQVCNGGFMQWHDNGYSSEAGQMLIILEKYKKGNPAITKAIQLIQEAVDTIKNVANESSNRNRYSWGDEEDEEEWDILNGKLSSLDDYYYKIDDQFLAEMQIVLQGL